MKEQPSSKRPTPKPVVVYRYATSGLHAFRGDVRQLNEPITFEIPSLGIQTQARFYDGHSYGDDHRNGLAFQKAVEINTGEVM